MLYYYNNYYYHHHHHHHKYGRSWRVQEFVQIAYFDTRGYVSVSSTFSRPGLLNIFKFQNEFYILSVQP